jgi:hypothetical protein
MRTGGRSANLGTGSFAAVNGLETVGWMNSAVAIIVAKPIVNPAAIKTKGLRSKFMRV